MFIGNYQTHMLTSQGRQIMGGRPISSMILVDTPCQTARRTALPATTPYSVSERGTYFSWMQLGFILLQ